jgi:hypothetical protein
MRVLLAAVVAGLAAEILSTLPADEHEAGTWIAGFCWAFLIFCILLLAVTMAWAKAHGVAL